MCGGANPNSPAGHAIYMISKPRTAAPRVCLVPACLEDEEQQQQQHINNGYVVIPRCGYVQADSIGSGMKWA